MRNGRDFSSPNLRAGTDSGGSKRALLGLLRRGGRLGDAGQVIVYATFQKQAAGVAAFLDANGVSAAAYHASKAMQVGPVSAVSSSPR
jgi:superfamily II DNA helicase RecQ